jgi:hypothetical protein
MNNWVNTVTVSESMTEVENSASTDGRAVKRTKLYTFSAWQDMLLLNLKSVSLVTEYVDRQSSWNKHRLSSANHHGPQWYYLPPRSEEG